MDTPTQVSREGLEAIIASYRAQRQAACEQCDTAIRVVQGILDAAYPPVAAPTIDEILDAAKRGRAAQLAAEAASA
jgi:hypothetical protein